MDPYRWSRCEWVKMLVFVSVAGPEFKLQYHYSILLFLISYLLLCHPFKVLSISQLLTMVLKLMSLVLLDLRLKTQFMKVSEMEIQVLNLETWDIWHWLSTINSSSIILQQTSMIVQSFYCVVILQTVLNSNIKLMPLLISRIVLMKPRRRVKNCWQLLRNFRNYLKKQKKVH